MVNGTLHPSQRQAITSTVDLLKIDTEGQDLKVIYGAEAALQHHQIQLLVFEFGANWGDSGLLLRDAVEFLDKYGYDSYMLSTGKVHLKLNGGLFDEVSALRFSAFLTRNLFSFP